MIYQNGYAARRDGQAGPAQAGAARLTDENPAWLAQRQTATPRGKNCTIISRGQALDATGLATTRSFFREIGARKRRFDRTLNKIANDSN
jgi:hypothetical protein